MVSRSSRPNLEFSIWADEQLKIGLAYGLDGFEASELASGA